MSWAKTPAEKHTFFPALPPPSPHGWEMAGEEPSTRDSVPLGDPPPLPRCLALLWPCEGGSRPIPGMPNGGPSPLEEHKPGQGRVTQNQEEDFEQPVVLILQLLGQDLKEGDEEEGAPGDSLQDD